MPLGACRGYRMGSLGPPPLPPLSMRDSPPNINYLFAFITLPPPAFLAAGHLPFPAFPPSPFGFPPPPLFPLPPPLLR